MKKNSLQSYKVQYRLKTEVKTTNQIPISPLRMSSLIVVHCRILMQLFYGRFISCCVLIFPVTAKNTAGGIIPLETAGFQKKMKKKQGQAVFENKLFFLAKKVNGP